MHQKHGGENLVCMSVSVDPPEGRAAALKFLQLKRATFPNYWLDEDISVWQDKFNINGPPAVFVFGQSGKVAKKFESGDPGYEYSEIEQFVQELLKNPR